MIRIENINKFYKLGKGRFHALKDVSLEIGDGEFVSVEGRSGAGKTTLLHILGCLDSFDSGTYLLNGRSVGKMGDRMLAGIRNREIGFVMQDFALISQEDVLFNIMLPLYFSHTKHSRMKALAIEMLELVGLGDQLGKKVSQLSGGQKQRVAIARVLANDPEIILCDEATSALDPMTTESILSLLQTINRTQNITIVVITHEMKVIQQICNRVAVLDEGRIQETGPVSEVFSHPQTRAAKRLVLARMQDADAPCVKLELPEDDKELAALMAYVKAHNLKVLEGEEHV